MTIPVRKRSVVLVLCIVAVLVTAILGWRASQTEHIAIGSSEYSFVIDCEFDKFRQIMVRKNATRAIVDQTGMRLLSEQVQAVDLDTSRDDRPLLNAIRGKSKTELSAKKLLMVQLDDPALDAEELVLQQNADIQEHQIRVRTASQRPAGRLENYQTTLNAQPEGMATRVTLTVDMNVRVRVPIFFTYRADQRVQKAADSAIGEQGAALEQFIVQHADERIVLPDLGR